MIDWLQKPSTIVWGLYLAAAELSSCLPSYSFSCILISDENSAKDYSGNQSCATVHEAVFRFVRFIWVNANHDNINAFAAVAIDEGRDDAALQVECALFVAGSAALDNAGKNIQIHGGIGFSDEADPHLLLKRAQLLVAIAGGLEAANDRISNIKAAW